MEKRAIRTLNHLNINTDWELAAMSDIVQKLWGFCHTLRHDGIAKALAGITTLAEVIRVTMD